MDEFTREIGAMGVGTDMAVLPSPMEIRTKESTNLIRDTEKECTSGMMVVYMMANSWRTNDMAKVDSPGRMVLFMMENLSMDKEKDMANIHLPMVDSTKDLGRMDDMMALERVLGKMEGVIVGNGAMEWPMDVALKPTLMEMSDTKDSGMMMSRCVKWQWHG
mmetsp:Transcript_29880/g.56062  ORF Transcript_29880/g.56062 Transcript_29880/m.56062 type:complete len:162 (+) Transcript_29880:476-961(+)